MKDLNSDREEYEFYNSEQFPALFEDKLTFGCYEGDTYEWVLKHDSDYLIWAFNTVVKSRKYVKRLLKVNKLQISNNKIISL